MLMQLEARLQTSATLFNFGNLYATHPSDEKGRESIHVAELFRSGSAEQLSLLFALIFVTVCRFTMQPVILYTAVSKL